MICKSYSHFSAKNTWELYIVLTRTVSILITNELVKLTALWTTRSWFWKFCIANTHSCASRHYVAIIIIIIIIIRRRRRRRRRRKDEEEADGEKEDATQHNTKRIISERYDYTIRVDNTRYVFLSIYLFAFVVKRSNISRKWIMTVNTKREGFHLQVQHDSIRVKIMVCVSERHVIRLL